MRNLRLGLGQFWLQANCLVVLSLLASSTTAGAQEQQSSGLLKNRFQSAHRSSQDTVQANDKRAIPNSFDSAASSQQASYHNVSPSTRPLGTGMSTVLLPAQTLRRKSNLKTFNMLNNNYDAMNKQQYGQQPGFSRQSNFTERPAFSRTGTLNPGFFGAPTHSGDTPVMNALIHSQGR